MSEELRPCPFCGGTNICTEKGINLNYCDNCSAESNVERWNARPIEDALNKRIAELENFINQLIEAGNEMQSWRRNVNAYNASRAYDYWDTITAEWKESQR
jgi:NMD protein affecting ribosome stability and mRNA decay